MSSSFSVLRLDSHNVYLLEDFGSRAEFRRARRKLTDAEKMREDTGVLLTRELSWPIRRHRYANSLEQITQGEAVPVREEFAARQRGSRFTSRQRKAVARRAITRVELRAAFGLLRRINAIPHRACLLLLKSGVLKR